MFFLMPPTGATGAAGPAALRAGRVLFRAPLPPRPAPRRWVETISSRDWSSFPDILVVLVGCGRKEVLSCTVKMGAKDGGDGFGARMRI